MIEETIKSEHIYSGRVLNLRVDTVKGPNGITTREIVDHSQAVTIIPFKEPDTVYLIHQFRKAVDRILIEAPAGCMELNEVPLKAAKRELQEETGFKAEHFHKLGEMYMAPGFCNEYMHYFVASGLTAGDTSFDADETMELKSYSIDQIMALIKNKEIIDAKTVMGIYFLNEYIGRI